MDKKTLTILILITVILVGAGVWAYRYIEEKSYEQGINDAVLLVNQQILNSLNQNGYVAFVFELNNETFRINLIPYGNATRIK